MTSVCLAFVSASTAAAGLAILLDAAAKGTAVLLIASLVVLALRRSSAAARHLIWTAGLVGALAMPLVSLVGPKVSVLPSWLQAAALVQLLEGTNGERLAADRPPALRASLGYGTFDDVQQATHSEAGRPNVATPNSGQSLSAGSTPGTSSAAKTDRFSAEAGVLAIAGLWLLGTAIWLARIGLSRLVLGGVVTGAVRVEDGSLRESLHAACGRYGLGRDVPTYLSDRRELPMTWGIFRPCILLPSESVAWPPGRLEAVLLHELAHIQRRDTLTHVLGQLACAMYWPNPLVWLAAWRVHVERERACDDLVVGHGVRPSDYATHLLGIVGQCRRRRLVPCSAVAMARSSSLEGRLVAILDERVARWALTRRLLAAVLAASVVAVAAVATLDAADEEPAGEPSGPATDATDGQTSEDKDESEPRRHEAIESADHVVVRHANAFLQAALNGEVAEAEAHTAPEFPQQQIEDFRELGLERLTVERVWHDAAAALAITEILTVENPPGKEEGRLVIRLENRGGAWLVRDVDFETDESLEGEIKRFRSEYPGAKESVVASFAPRRFVRLVVGPDEMTFEGRKTTRQELPDLLEKVPNRGRTVLEVAIADDEMTVAELNQAQQLGAVLADRWGFDYSSYIGVHPLGSVGSRHGLTDGEEAGAPSEEEQRSERGVENGPATTTPRGTRALGATERRALFDLIARGKLDGFVSEVFSPLNRELPEDGLQRVAELASMSQSEAAALDRLLRREEFEGLEHLLAHKPPQDTSDADLLRPAIAKLNVLWAKQSVVLEEISQLRSAEELSAEERQALDMLEAAINQQHAGHVLTIRQAFRPDPTSDARASWSAVTRRGDGSMFALARSPVGGEFPIRLDGEEDPRFRVRVVGGGDDAVVVVVLTPEQTRQNQVPHVEHRLVRDQLLHIDVGGERFSLLYPSSSVRRSDNAVTDQAHFVIGYHPDQNGTPGPNEVTGEADAGESE